MTAVANCAHFHPLLSSQYERKFRDEMALLAQSGRLSLIHI